MSACRRPTWKRIGGHAGGWRIDHVFASSQMLPIACRYHHIWRDQDPSDHSGLEAELA
jgi:exonuclease III